MEENQLHSGKIKVETRTQLVDGPTENVFGSIVDQMLGRLESISVTMGILKFRGKTTHQTSARCEWILSRKLGGSEDITQTSPVQDPSWSTFHSLTALNRPRYLHGQLSTSLSVFGDVCT